MSAEEQARDAVVAQERYAAAFAEFRRQQELGCLTDEGTLAQAAQQVEATRQEATTALLALVRSAQ